MPDTPQRIATDTSQKLAIRFGETIKAYEASKELHTYDLTLIPLVFAGWLRYLMGIDDNGNPFTLSPDQCFLWFSHTFPIFTSALSLMWKPCLLRCFPMQLYGE